MQIFVSLIDRRRVKISAVPLKEIIAPQPSSYLSIYNLCLST